MATIPALNTIIMFNFAHLYDKFGQRYDEFADWYSEYHNSNTTKILY
jgi:hypothetical protein